MLDGHVVKFCGMDVAEFEVIEVINRVDASSRPRWAGMVRFLCDGGDVGGGGGSQGG